MSGPEYLLDTNVLIGFLAGRDWAVSFIGRASDEKASFAISSISRMELLGFPGVTADEEQRISELLSHLHVQQIDMDIEDRTIQLRRSRRMKLPDAIVAATALHLSCPLVSADADFDGIDGLTIVNPAR